MEFFPKLINVDESILFGFPIWEMLTLSPREEELSASSSPASQSLSGPSSCFPASES